MVVKAARRAPGLPGLPRGGARRRRDRSACRPSSACPQCRSGGRQARSIRADAVRGAAPARERPEEPVAAKRILAARETRSGASRAQQRRKGQELIASSSDELKGVRELTKRTSCSSAPQRARARRCEHRGPARGQLIAGGGAVRRQDRRDRPADHPDRRGIRAPRSMKELRDSQGRGLRAGRAQGRSRRPAQAHRHPLAAARATCTSSTSTPSGA